MGSGKTIASLYDKNRASTYDSDSHLFLLIGFRMEHYRKKAIEGLGLKNGDTVIDLCCGTGLNFPLLEKAVGQEGRIIGVDVSAGMLSEARKKIEHNGWDNVELINCDVAEYRFPKNIDGIITSYAITLVPQYDGIIRKGAEALKPGKRFVILDFKRPKGWPDWLVRLAVRLLFVPFGANYEMINRHPWESIEKNLNVVSFREFYFRSVYIDCGVKTRK